MVYFAAIIVCSKFRADCCRIMSFFNKSREGHIRNDLLQTFTSPARFFAISAYYVKFYYNMEFFFLTL